jgi:hypothetical protein
MKASPPVDIIFSNEQELGLVKLIDGPTLDGDSLASVYRAKNLRGLYDKNFLFHATPRMLSPSAAKLVYAANANDFWRGMGNAGSMNGGLAIIGFSLPHQDDYAKQILYTLVTNYQRYNQFHLLGDRQAAAPLAIVDRFSDANAKSQFKERYRFVDWTRTSLCGSGFDMSSLDEIFG